MVTDVHRPEKLPRDWAMEAKVGMSVYADLVCDTCKVQLWLGKALRDKEGRVFEFAIGEKEDGPNSQNVVLTRTLWKFLADHGQHGARVVLDYDPNYDVTSGYSEIGGDGYGDVSFEEYLRSWNG